MDAASNTHFLPRPIVFGRQEPISSIIWRLGKNFETDILGRMLWCQKKLDTLFEHKQQHNHATKAEVTIEHVKLLDATSCVSTHNAVMSLFFGKLFNASSALTTLHPHPELSISEMKAIIIEKEASANISYRLQNAFLGFLKVAEMPLDESHWTVFSVKMFMTTKEKAGIVHAFVILQAYENGIVFYKILQSFINQYPFNKHDLSYSGSQIFLMLDQLLDYVTAAHWNASHQQLFNFFFKSRELLPCGKPMDCLRWVKIQWGDVTRESIERHAIDFSRVFPSHFKICVHP